jgi:hypothetical protein
VEVVGVIGSIVWTAASSLAASCSPRVSATTEPHPSFNTEPSAPLIPGRPHTKPGKDPPPVWPWKNGTTRGLAFTPLYPSVPEAAARNPALGELLALFDAVRGGSAREQALAMALLEERLQS